MYINVFSFLLDYNNISQTVLVLRYYLIFEYFPSNLQCFCEEYCEKKLSVEIILENKLSHSPQGISPKI